MTVAELIEYLQDQPQWMKVYAIASYDPEMGPHPDEPYHEELDESDIRTYNGRDFGLYIR